MSKLRSFDGHTHFVHFSNLSRHLSNPIWFTILRHPMTKFRSRFHFNRRLICQKRIKAGIVRDNETLEQCLKKNLEECVLTADPECVLPLGQRIHESYDLSIVKHS